MQSGLEGLRRSLAGMHRGLGGCGVAKWDAAWFRGVVAQLYSVSGGSA